MIKVMVVFGTRPEAIKMCPLVNELKKRKNIDVFTCVSGQHKDLLNKVIEIFGVEVDFDLKIMKEAQTLFDITTKILDGVKNVLKTARPDLVLVHGDTSTAFAVALASFYMGIPVGHVEAGLRSGDILEPYPEEFNRRSISLISSFDFAPTILSAENLIKEGKPKEKIFVTGNTVIDALKTTVRDDYTHPLLGWAGDKKLVILTSHRRENAGDRMRSIFKAARRIADERNDVRIICPLHPNPIIRKIAETELGGCLNVSLTHPLDVFDFHNILSRVTFIVTDSGGLQEEGVALGKPVLVLRNKTERPEGIASGGLKLIGTDEDEVYKNVNILLDDANVLQKMSSVDNPYGDGNASRRIADIIEKKLSFLTFDE